MALISFICCSYVRIICTLIVHCLIVPLHWLCACSMLAPCCTVIWPVWLVVNHPIKDLLPASMFGYHAKFGSPVSNCFTCL